MKARVLVIGGTALYFAAKGAGYLKTFAHSFYLEAAILMVLFLCAGYIIDYIIENLFVKKEE